MEMPDTPCCASATTLRDSAIGLVDQILTEITPSTLRELISACLTRLEEDIEAEGEQQQTAANAAEAVQVCEKASPRGAQLDKVEDEPARNGENVEASSVEVEKAEQAERDQGLQRPREAPEVLDVIQPEEEHEEEEAKPPEASEAVTRAVTAGAAKQPRQTPETSELAGAERAGALVPAVDASRERLERLLIDEANETELVMLAQRRKFATCEIDRVCVARLRSGMLVWHVFECVRRLPRC